MEGKIAREIALVVKNIHAGKLGYIRVRNTLHPATAQTHIPRGRWVERLWSSITTTMPSFPHCPLPRVQDVGGEEKWK